MGVNENVNASHPHMFGSEWVPMMAGSPSDTTYVAIDDQYKRSPDTPMDPPAWSGVRDFASTS
jgi:hypothetical protein